MAGAGHQGGAGRAAPRRPGPAAAGRSRDAGLSRAQVLDAAMEILVTEGMPGLTVRGLAAKLGVAVTAVYWHVGDKQALVDGLVERIIDQFSAVTVSVRGTTHEERLLSLARSLRRSLLDQADLVNVVHRQGRIAALFQPARRAVVAELVDAGLDGPAVALGAQAIIKLVVGSVLLDRQVDRQPAQHEELADPWGTGDLPGAPDLFASLTRPVDQETVFVYSLRALVGAVLGGLTTARSSETARASETGPRRVGRRGQQ